MGYLGEWLVVVGVMLLLGYLVIRYLDGHKHKWELDKHVVIPSNLEKMSSLGKSVGSWSGHDLVEKHVLVYICKDCGKMKVIKEEK